MGCGLPPPPPPPPKGAKGAWWGVVAVACCCANHRGMSDLVGQIGTGKGWRGCVALAKRQRVQVRSPCD